MSKKSDALKQELSKIRIEFSIDDELTAMVLDNTYGNTQRAVTNVIKCLTLIAGGTSMYTAGKLTGISINRIMQWKRKQWYHDALAVIQQRLDDQLDANFTGVINRGTHRAAERLDKGDPIVDIKSGEVVGYKPVSAKDAAVISSIFFDKRNLLRNKPTSINQTQSSEDKLRVLQQQFRNITNQEISEAEYTEVDNDEAEDTETKTLDRPREKSFTFSTTSE